MNVLIKNRDGNGAGSGWYNIEAKGEHVNHGSKVVQVIDGKAVRSIVSRFEAEAKTAGDDHAGLPIDKDHLGSSLENPSEALGWLMGLRDNSGVLEGRIAWTPLGTPLVHPPSGLAPAYKFFSTEYHPDDCEKIGERVVNGKKYAVVRPLRLDGLSLTNDPNNKGQRPISNRGSEAHSSSVTADGATSEKARAEKLWERAQELKKANPKSSFRECWNRACDEFPPAQASHANGSIEKGDDQQTAASISNRAASLRSAAPRRSFRDCWMQATIEHYGSR